MLIPAIVPFTLTAMMGTVEKLLDIAEKKDSPAGVAGEKDTDGLIKQWLKLNLVRLAFPLVGTVAAAWAVVNTSALQWGGEL